MRFAKIVFFVAGTYGLVVLTPLYFMERAIGQAQPPAITHPEYFYGFIGVGLAWQVLFLILATDPFKYRSMILPCVIEKVGYGVAAVVLFRQQRLAVTSLAIGSVDWIFAALFIKAFIGLGPTRAKRARLPLHDLDHKI